jgi:hypothetical protein
MAGDERVRWAQKVRQARIWQLCHKDAQGVIDEQLIDDGIEQTKGMWQAKMKEVERMRRPGS